MWGSLIAGAFLFCYAGVLRDLTSEWWKNTVYSYGFLIPGISGYLVWTRRSRLQAIPARSSPVRGSLLLIAGLALLVTGRAARLNLAGEFSILVVISGACLLVWGAARFRELLFPIGYLAFMIPAWDFFTTRLHPPLQLFAARAGIALLEAVGVPVAREGTKILLPHRTLEVAQACSGVNFLIAVVALGIPLAALTLRGWTRRVLLIVFGVAVAIGSNSLRVALIGILSYLGYAGDVHGPGHMLQGMFVAVIGYVALFAGAWFLSRDESRRMATKPRPADPVTHPGARAPSVLPAAFVCAALLGTGAYLHLHRSRPAPLTNRLCDFPRSIGSWRGEDVTPDDTLFAAFRGDSTLVRIYRRAPDEEVILCLGYDASQPPGHNALTDRTRLLHEGARVATIPVEQGDSILAAEVVRPFQDRACVVLLWYDMNQRQTPNRLSAKLHTGWADIARGRSNGGVVGVLVGCRTPAEQPRASDRATEFVGDAFPFIRRYLSSD